MTIDQDGISDVMLERGVYVLKSIIINGLVFAFAVLIMLYLFAGNI
jgi:hypothetical protein